MGSPLRRRHDGRAVRVTPACATRPGLVAGVAPAGNAGGCGRDSPQRAAYCGGRSRSPTALSVGRSPHRTSQRATRCRASLLGTLGIAPRGGGGCVREDTTRDRPVGMGAVEPIDDVREVSGVVLEVGPTRSLPPPACTSRLRRPGVRLALPGEGRSAGRLALTRRRHRLRRDRRGGGPPCWPGGPCSARRAVRGAAVVAPRMDYSPAVPGAVREDPAETGRGLEPEGAFRAPPRL